MQGVADPNAQDDVTGSTQVIGTTTIAALFAGVTFAGTDADATSLDNGAIGFARSGAGVSPVEFTASFGADGAAATNSVVHTLSIPGGAAANGTVNSGLDTTDGRSIYLFQQNGLIIGRVDADNSGSASATEPAAFAIAINPTTGELYVAQYLSLDHPMSGNGTTPPGSFDDQLVLANDAIRVTVTVTDHDGDQASSAAISIGKYIGFQDDGPSVSANAVVYSDDETATNPDAAPNLGGTGDYDGLTPAANLTGTLAHSYGSDGAGTTLLLGTGAPSGFTYTLSAGGTVLTISQVQDSVSVDVLRVTLSNTTSGAYTVVQLNEIDHPTPGASEENILFNIGYRVTDGDGDTVDGSLSIDVDDDTPTVAANAIVYTDDETALTPDAAPNAGGTGDYDGTTPPANLTGILAHSYGADGAGSTLLLGTGAPAGFTYTLTNGGRF